MSAAQATASKKMSGVLQRFVVSPCINTARKIEHRSAAKLQCAEPAIAKMIAAHEATGADAASLSTKRYLSEQSQLINYRVVRFFEECRYLASGQYAKHYDMGCALKDARFLTQALFVFLMTVMVGRRSVYPPIRPDSPLAIALEHKVNPNY